MDPKQIIDAAVKWVRGVLFEPEATAEAYRVLTAPWQKTLTEIALPVAVVSFVVGFVLSLLTGGTMMFGAAASAPFWFLLSLVWSVGFLFVAAFVFDYFAGNYGGTRSFDQSFALVSLAMIPGMLGGVLSPLPLLGPLLSLLASLYGVWLLYRFVPIFLAVPEANRLTHIVVSVLVCLVANIVVGMTLGGAMAMSATT